MLGHIFSMILHPDTTAKTGCLHSWVMKTKVQNPKCDGLNENGPQRLINLISGPQLVELIGKDWECDLVGGGTSPGGGFEVSTTSLLPCADGCELSAASPGPWLPACCHAPHHGGHGPL